ncbi:MAG: ArsR family transcriptional regulator, partial [Oscillospiraceae bacterium]|nr:ArsR family transcriptional regulator [Oscillospiraceae bacterium]
DKVETIAYIDVESRLKGCSEDQKKLLRLLSDGEKHVDELVAASGQSAAKVSAELTLLSIRGLVSVAPGRRYSIK